MKTFWKLCAFLIGVGGSLYWLGKALVRPVCGLWAAHKAKKEQLAEYYADRNSDV